MKLKHKLMSIVAGVLIGGGIFYKELQMFQYAGYVPNSIDWLTTTYILAFLLMSLAYVVILISRKRRGL